MNELIVKCDGDKISFTCTASNTTKTTSDQDEASFIFNSWIKGGIL